MTRPEVEKLRGIIFTEEEVNDIIKPAMPVDANGKLAYMKCIIHEVKEERDDIVLVLSHELPYYMIVSRKMNPFGDSESDALKFVKNVFTEVFGIIILDDGTRVPASNFNIDNYNFKVTSQYEGGYTIEITVNKKEEK